MKYQFFKYQGAGNDFILFEPDTAPALTPELTARLCNRHFGIGADGILLLSHSEKADWKMRILNSDGSEAEMCGNGLRCTARHIAERFAPEAEKFVIETMLVLNPCIISRKHDGAVEEVECLIGQPSFDTARLAPGLPPELLDAELERNGLEVRGTYVDMGNPHLVCFESPDPLEVEKTYGPTFEHHPFFPHRTNVEFVRVTGPQQLEVTVWERGAGITLACGSGACASAAAAMRSGRVNAGQPVQLQLPGGLLTVTRRADGLWLKGPAELVFEGKIEIY